MKQNKKVFSNPEPRRIQDYSVSRVVWGNNLQIMILIIATMILLGISIYFEKIKTASNYRVPDTSNIQVEVTGGQGALPDNPAAKNNQDNSSSPQQGVATIQDLGGNASQSAGIDDLLKDKQIQVK